MATVPLAASDWIIRYLCDQGEDIPDWKAKSLVETGLDVFTVKQLKIIWNALEPHTFVRRPGSNAKKALWVNNVRLAFYKDSSSCVTPDDEILTRLPSCDGHARVPAPSAGASRAHVATAVPSPRPRMSAAHMKSVTAYRKIAPVRPAGQLVLACPAHAAAAAAAANVSRRSLSPPDTGPIRRRPIHIAPIRPATATACLSHGRDATRQQVTPLSQYPFHSGPQLQQQQQQQPMSPCAMPQQLIFPLPMTLQQPLSTPPSKKVKKEKKQEHRPDHVYWETHPRTPQEHAMVSQLRQMGFTGVREMLAGIRHVATTTDVTEQNIVEAAMMWIVSQREEAEEARKLDSARVRSEELRAEQAQRRKQAAHERLWGTTYEEWLSEADLFQGSVVLAKARACLEPLLNAKASKATLITFLQLEKKARFWYGCSVPWCYLVEVSAAWAQLSSAELVKSVEREAKAFESAMYSLKQQQGGVPRLFLAARDRAIANGKPTGPENGDSSSSADNDDDDDILAVRDLPSSLESRCSSRQSSGKTGEAEVIEIA